MMKRYYLTTLAFVLTLLAASWVWTEKNRFSFLSVEYPVYMGKFELMDHYSKAGLVVFGDSRPMAAILPDELNPKAVNFSLTGAAPEEIYFFARRLMNGPVHPTSVLISIDPLHFVSTDTFWERGVKFGVIGKQDIDEILNLAWKFQDDQFLPPPKLFGIGGQIKYFLLSHWFPTYYFSSIISAHLNGRKSGNEAALESVLAQKGHFYMGTEKGSKELDWNVSHLGDFQLSPLLNYYFLKTLTLFKESGIPVYFISLPINEVSKNSVPPIAMGNFRHYLESVAANDPNFHVLSGIDSFYPWECFGDPYHLNEKGATRLSKELADVLNKAGVPGGPFGH